MLSLSPTPEVVEFCAQRVASLRFDWSEDGINLYLRGHLPQATYGRYHLRYLALVAEQTKNNDRVPHMPCPPAAAPTPGGTTAPATPGRQ